MIFKSNPNHMDSQNVRVMLEQMRTIIENETKLTDKHKVNAKGQRLKGIKLIDIQEDMIDFIFQYFRGTKTELAE